MAGSVHRYYDGIIENADVYADASHTLIYDLTTAQTLKVEFHLGDIVYYVNNCQIGCTGGEYQLQIFPFADLFKYTEKIKDNRIFLLLPMTVVTKQDIHDLKQKLSYIPGIILYDTPVCHQMANYIIYGLMRMLDSLDELYKKHLY